MRLVNNNGFDERKPCGLNFVLTNFEEGKAVATRVSNEHDTFNILPSKCPDQLSRRIAFVGHNDLGAHDSSESALRGEREHDERILRMES